MPEEKPKPDDPIKKGLSKEESEEYLKSYMIETPKIDLKPTPQDPISKSIPCECGKPSCNMGLLIRKYPEDKIKIQIFEGDEIKSVVIDKQKLLEELKEC